MSAVWPLDIPATDKMVLLALADAANDDGVTWIAVKSRSAGKLDILTKCSLSERAIQGAIKRLCVLGHLHREERIGKGCIYTVQPNGTPPADAPPQDMRPAANDADPRISCGETVSNRHSNSEAKASSLDRERGPNAANDHGFATAALTLVAAPDRSRKASRTPASKFVPESWTPNSAHFAKAASLGVDLGKQTELFRNHEYAKPKTDFDRAFHTWLTNAKDWGGSTASNRHRSGGTGFDPFGQAIRGMTFEDDAA